MTPTDLRAAFCDWYYKHSECLIVCVGVAYKDNRRFSCVLDPSQEYTDPMHRVITVKTRPNQSEQFITKEGITIKT